MKIDIYIVFFGRIFEGLTSDLSHTVNQFTAELEKCEAVLDRAMKKTQSDDVRAPL